MDYNTVRRKTKKIKVGSIYIGGDSPVTVQSMTNTDTHDLHATLAQVARLQECGCDIVRITTPDIESVEIFRYLKQNGITVPLVADVHFDYRIAVAAIKAGADKIRINPGNIGSREGVIEVVNAAREHSVPIRIGVNSGSVPKDILEKYTHPTPDALVEAAMRHVSILESLEFYDIIISIKASSPEDLIVANRKLSEKVNHPLHLGLTEAGFGDKAIIKSSVGIGTLLMLGIGDTIRISLTDDPTEEVRLGKELLSLSGIGSRSVMDIISCPTCGRTKIDLISLSREFESRAAAEGLLDLPVKVALMGCAVNGPGEAKEADIGIAGGKGEALIFKHGTPLYKVPENRAVDELIAQIKKMAADRAV